MSSGSYFTLYRKCKKDKVSAETLNALKNEYFLYNKKDNFSNSKNEEEMKKDMPILFHAGFKADFEAREAEDNKTDVYYDADGVKHIRLLEFCFGSVFTALKEHFDLNPYKFSQSSVLVSKVEAEKILQAIEYVLSENYSKKFESILNNEYVNMLGDGYSPFDKRFKTTKDPIYIDKDGDNYTVTFNDYSYDAEMRESDEDVRFNLNRVKACLLAYLNAEEKTWDGEELVLEYSAY